MKKGIFQAVLSETKGIVVMKKQIYILEKSAD
jgi:hypothetical protein